MTISLALDYIPRRMKELGYADNYSIQFRHFVLSSKQKIKVHAQNHFFILVEPNDSVAVRSGTGIYDLTIDNANELQYEHQGEIRIRNYSIVTQHARFIQVIPNENKQCP